MTKTKILIVEDELDVQMHLKVFLEEAGPYDVLTASTISNAVELVNNNPDLSLIITDVSLPSEPGMHPSGESGLSFLETIRSRRPDIPVIVVTAYLESFAEQLLRFGATTVLRKGTSKFTSELLSRISQALTERGLQYRKEIDESAVLTNLRSILIHEIEKYSSAKEKLIHIPGDREYELIKPLIGFKKDIEAQIERFPFSKNVFLMMKFRMTNREVGDYIVENLAKHGMRGIRADDDSWNITRNVYNPIAVLYCCKFGIALFDEPEEHQAYSPNVAYELGMMHYQNKHCLVLRHSSLPSIPFDLIKDLYVTYDRDLKVKQIIQSWIKQIATNEVTANG